MDEEIEATVTALAADLADNAGFGTKAYRKQFEDRARTEVRKVIVVLADERDRYRAALEVIAGSSDRVQALQAACALENIGPDVR